MRGIGGATDPGTLAKRLHGVFAADAFTLDEAERLVYGYDNSRREGLPDAVVFPTTHDEVVALVRLCRELALAGLSFRRQVPPGRPCRWPAASSPVSSA